MWEHSSQGAKPRLRGEALGADGDAKCARVGVGRAGGEGGIGVGSQNGMRSLFSPGHSCLF